MCHTHFVERVPIRSCHVLDDNVTVDEVGTYPGGVEGRASIVQEHNTDYVIADVTFLVHLKKVLHQERITINIATPSRG